MTAEGWYQDPYGAHADRWFSDGEATSLVRDGDVESKDPPPASPPPQPLVPCEEKDQDDGGEDLRRADDAQRQEGPKKSQFEAALEVLVFHPVK